MSDLALEQDSRNIKDDRHITEADITVPKATEGVKELGHVFLVIFQASRSTLRKAMADLQGESVVSGALRTLIAHVGVTDGDDRDTMEMERMQEVSRPLLDKILKKSDDSGKKVAFTLLDWLMLEYPHRQLMLRALSTDLTPLNDKKRKLAVLLALEHTLQTQRKSRSASRKTSTKSGPIMDTTQTPPGTADKDGTRSMTRLTSLAFDVSITLSSIHADQTIQEITSEEAARKSLLVVEVASESVNDGSSTSTRASYVGTLMDSMASMYRVIKDFQSWNTRTSTLATAALIDISDIIVRFNKHQNKNRARPPTEVMKSFARTWKVISSALGQRTIASALTTILDQVRTYLQMQDIPPFLRLLASCLVLGFCDSTTPIDQAIQKSGDVKASLLAFSNSTLTEDIPVGKHAALALQDILIPVLGESDFELIKGHIISILSSTVKVSESSASMVAQYTVAFPAFIIPELLQRLQKTGNDLLANDMQLMKTRNTLRVVEALAEKDYFLKTITSEEEKYRELLENAVIALLQDADIMIRLTSSQIVATLDPAKIVNKFAYDLTLADKGAMSSAELVLLECMLSQRKDGSLGGGFVAFLDYIRHFNNAPRDLYKKDEATKVKSPAQLFSKAKVTAVRSMKQADVEESLYRLFRVVKKLGESIPSFLWSSFIDSLVAKTYGSPADHLLIRVWNNFAPSIASSSDAIASLIAVVAELMEQQGVVTEDMLDHALEASDEAIDELRLSRLSPLLILKTVPSYAIARYLKTIDVMRTDDGVESLSRKITRVLKSRSENELEFGLVRKLALGTLQGMFPDSSLETIHAHLAKQFTDEPSRLERVDLEDGRSWIFALYNWVLNWTIQSNSKEQTERDIAWLHRIIGDFFYRIMAITNLGKDLEQDLYKLQLGALDVLSKILLATAPFYVPTEKTLFSKRLDRINKIQAPSTTVKIEEIEDDEQDEKEDAPLSPKSPGDLFISLLTDILSRIVSPMEGLDQSRIPQAVCLANVLVMTMQSLASGTTPTIVAGTVSDANVHPPSSKWTPCLIMDLITPSLGANLTSILHDGDLASDGHYTPLIQACIQILYTGASAAATVEERATSRNTNHWAMNVAVLGLGCTKFAVAVASLKLLATMSATKMMTTELLTATNLAAIRKGFARLHQSKELQTNEAPEITTLLDKMWEMVA
ncbi:hypothetical protein BGZ50_007966 [Haplosporangium sp. Z 11]|nr:hypothetical protein BGZ50_007966 [Haplosporangium sp. Z 11]